MTKNYRGYVFVQGSFMNRTTGDLFTDRGFVRTNDIEEADLVVWTGGEDIYPGIYGQETLSVTYYNSDRDKKDIDAIEKAEGKFKVGICRGAQLLNCIDNGGTLWQHVNNHNGNNHNIIDARTNKIYVINSLHHQGIRLTDKAILLAYNTLSTRKQDDTHIWRFSNDRPEEEKDVEAAYYPETHSLLFQGHPEFGGADTVEYFFKLFDEFYQKWYEQKFEKKVV